MKVSDEKMQMAYALGGATCGKEPERKRIELGTVNSDWDGYVIIGHGMKNEMFNNTYDLWYHGDHGREKGFTRIMKIEEGWKLNHAVALMLDAVKMHKSENKEKEKTE